MPLIEISRPDPGIVALVLNRPEKRNALSTSLLVELSAALADAEADRQTRCVVLAGDAKAFSAGADIAEMQAGGLQVLKRPERVAAWAAIESFPKPLIAAVEGIALGGGNELVMLADIVVAGASARFGQPEVAIGGMPGDGGTQRLVRLVGKGAAMRMILTGQPIDAETACRLGLAAEVVAAGAAFDRAVEIARMIAAAAPLAVRAAKQAVLQAFEMALSAGLRFEKQSMYLLATSRDRAEGMAAFLEKRAPRYSGD